jgi:hypothetical protein
MSLHIAKVQFEFRWALIIPEFAWLAMDGG